MSTMMPYFLRRPTEAAALRRTPDRPMPSASTEQLRGRLCRAIAVADGCGTLLLAHRIARAGR
ncbi:hypothetical protein [Streptomyces sp. NPDC002889]|uniref:hypothetical protein n=1 Tax=Streptomyces sp. NPDC002889 TaxID=3364669 RepID=UPI0036B50CE3